MFKSKLLLTLALCFGLSTGVMAQTDAESAALAAEIEAMRTIVQTERKILIMQELTLTDEEASNFWPLYDEYNAKVKEVGNLRIKVITDYAANYMEMTDEMATQLIKDSIKFEDQSIKLKKKYLKKFSKVLPGIKVARYMQLENKLNAIVNFDLAAEIPLVE